MTNIHFLNMMMQRHNTDEAGVRKIMAERGAKASRKNAHFSTIDKDKLKEISSKGGRRSKNEKG
jgi:hypothetical protein